MSKTKPPASSAPPTITVVHQPAWDVREVIWPLFEGFYAFVAVRSLGTMQYLERKRNKKKPPSIDVVTPRGDGTIHKFDLDTYLALAHEKPQISEALKRAWAVGALMTAADALDYYTYFDRAPCLELIYHLRNGVGHGNHFHFDGPAETRMQKYPAHNRESLARGNREHEITASLAKTEVLDAFMNPVDVQDCLQSAVDHLDKIALGERSPKARKPVDPV